MLDKVMMERKEVRKDYDERLAHLEIRMGELQRQCRSMGIPIVIVFEGFSASGKGTMIGRMIRPLDPRGFQVFTMERKRKRIKGIHIYGVMRRKCRQKEEFIFLITAGIRGSRIFYRRTKSAGTKSSLPTMELF